MVLLETPEWVFVGTPIPKVFVSTKPLSKYTPRTTTTTTTTTILMFNHPQPDPDLARTWTCFWTTTTTGPLKALIIWIEGLLVSSQGRQAESKTEALVSSKFNRVFQNSCGLKFFSGTGKKLGPFNKTTFYLIRCCVHFIVWVWKEAFGHQAKG